MPTLDEFALIRRFFTDAHLPPHIKTGVGDDGAVLAIPANHKLVVSVDTQLPSVHFPADTAPAHIATRALHCAASDLAAMGATPVGFTVALTLPSADENWLAAFSTGLFAAAAHLQCPLIGGDTTRGALCLSIQVLGIVPAGLAIKRSGAQAGDYIWISGCLGDGAAALALLEGRLNLAEAARVYLQERFYSPEIDFDLGVYLRTIATACIDVSDGLLADLGHVCTASRVAACLKLHALPLSAHWRDAVDSPQAQQWALAGGDDYRLCFTAPAIHSALLQSRQNLVCIGEIVDGDGVTVFDKHGTSISSLSAGFRHF